MCIPPYASFHTVYTWCPAEVLRNTHLIRSPSMSCNSCQMPGQESHSVQDPFSEWHIRRSTMQATWAYATELSDEEVLMVSSSSCLHYECPRRQIVFAHDLASSDVRDAGEHLVPILTGNIHFVNMCSVGGQRTLPTQNLFHQCLSRHP